MTAEIHTDVVVVGAGLGGLSAAGHLQESGYDIVLLEHHSVPGGYAHNFTRRGFRFEVALHALDGMEPGGWAYPMFKTLGAFDAVEFHRLDPFYTASFPDFEVDVSTDIPEYVAAVAQVFPEQRDAVIELFEAIKMVGHDMAKYASDRRNGVRIEQQEMPAHYPAMVMAFASTWEQFLDRFALSGEVKALVSTLWGYLGLPPSQLSGGQMALTLLTYHTSGAWYPEGGSGAMTKAFARKIIDRGGQIHYRNDAVSIVPNGADAVTVTTHRGLVVHAQAVVSNASPQRTIELLPADSVDASFSASADSEAAALSNLVVYLGLDRDVAEEGWRYHEFFDMPSYDLESEYKAIMRGDFANAGMIVSNYTLADPGCAPEGGSVLSLTSLAPWDFSDVWGTGGDVDDYSENEEYRRIKDEAGDVLIDRLAARIPGLRDAIVVKEVATPLTNVRYAMQPGGSIYGRQQTVMNQMNRRRPKTPVPNLFLAGAWVGGGGMTACVGSGKSAARAVDRYLSRSAP
jgi:phytoene dehydrogenase-like protein